MVFPLSVGAAEGPVRAGDVSVALDDAALDGVLDTRMDGATEATQDTPSVGCSSTASWQSAGSQATSVQTSSAGLVPDWGTQPCSGPGLACVSTHHCRFLCQSSGCDGTYAWCASVTGTCICDAT